MTDKKISQANMTELRIKAENRLESMLARLEGLAEEDVQDIKNLVHELQVHQIELEMQNEELRKLQNELEISRQKYFDLYNLAPTGYYTFNKDGQILEANLQAAQMLGLERQALLKENIYAFIHNEDCDLFYWHLAKVCETHEHHTCELRMHRKNGAQLDVYLESVGIENDGKIFKKCRTSITDISELKQAEAALRESEEKYRHLFENSNDAIYIMYQNQFQMVNKKFVEILGLSLAEVNRKEFDFISLVAPEGQSFIRERLNRFALGEENPPHYDFTALTRDGRKIEVEVCETLIKYNGGRAIQAILRDVSERKRLEEQLRQAQKMEAIGKLAGGIAHDFNNLLTVILGNAEILRVTLEKRLQQFEEIDEIKKAAERAALLTKQLLAFARKQLLVLKVVNLNKNINYMKKLLQRLIGENIELILDLDPGLDYIKADSTQLNQLFMNLVINSKEAISENGQITIRTRNITINAENRDRYRNAEPGKFVFLSVEDTGKGIESDILDKIFDPFFTTKGMAQGSGLGLSVVYGIIQQHKGWIHVISEKGRGTLFRILLPITEEIPIEETDETISLESLRGTGERILVIEDEEVVRNYVVKLLPKEGYSVFAAASAKEALHIFRREKGSFDLIFSDVILPDISGVRLAEMLILENPKIPVLLGSGYADHESEWPAIKEKGFHFISKPYSIPILLQQIKQILTRGK